ncbi:STAS domain-containing protein [Streptomyces bacillaris]|uniref:STAS domain-containing protein n=1 Tax=Streptomyces bacillaris TaxID=68179 RepID=UPI0033525407
MEPYTVRLLLCGDVAVVTPYGPMERVPDAVLASLLPGLGGASHAVVLDMGRVPFMSVGGLRLLDRLLVFGAETGVHVVTTGWQPQPLGVLGVRADRFVPPAPRTGSARLARAVESRALLALARGVSSAG